MGVFWVCLESDGADGQVGEADGVVGGEEGVGAGGVVGGEVACGGKAVGYPGGCVVGGVGVGKAVGEVQPDETVVGVVGEVGGVGGVPGADGYAVGEG